MINFFQENAFVNISIIRKLFLLIIITYVMIKSLIDWIKNKNREINDLVDLKNYIRSLDTNEIDTIDNVLINKLNFVNINQKLKEAIYKIAENVRKQSNMTMSELWNENMKITLESSNLKSSLYKEILNLGYYLNSYDVEIKSEKIKLITIELEEVIKKKELEFSKSKNFKIKERIIMCLLILVLII